MKESATGFLELRIEGHCLTDCITLKDVDGMGFSLKCFEKFQNKDVKITIELKENC